MSHTAKALVLHCMDFRFIHQIVHFMKKEGMIDQYDDVSAAGAAKNLIDPAEPSDKAFILRQIEIAKRLHAIEQVILINHRDCGAYGKIFDTPEAETARHEKDLKAAKILVAETFPGLHVKTLLATLVNPGEVSFEVVV